jgi:hypothetical protein
MNRSIVTGAALLLATATTITGCATEVEEPTADSSSAIRATHACSDEARGIDLGTLVAAPGTNAPNAVRLPSRIEGVVFRYLDNRNETGLVVDCGLIAPIYALAHWAAGRGITDIYHMGGLYDRNVAGQSSLSQHALGRAFDIKGVKLGGVTSWVSTDFRATAGNILFDLGTHLATDVDTVLGPGYDPDHANHLHVEIDGHLCSGFLTAWCRP